MAGNEEFRNIEMATIWILINTCLIPILTYGAEAWVPTKAEVRSASTNNSEQFHQTHTTSTNDHTIRNHHSGNRNMGHRNSSSYKKQIIYYNRICTTKNPESLNLQNKVDPKNPWRKRVEHTMRESKIDE